MVNFVPYFSNTTGQNVSKVPYKPYWVYSTIFYSCSLHSLQRRRPAAEAHQEEGALRGGQRRSRVAATDEGRGDVAILERNFQLYCNSRWKPSNEPAARVAGYN